MRLTTLQGRSNIVRRDPPSYHRETQPPWILCNTATALKDFDGDSVESSLQVESINKSEAGATTRLPLCFAVLLPTIPALRKEYGELLVSCGLVGEAITISESLELWDNLIHLFSWEKISVCGSHQCAASGKTK